MHRTWLDESRVAVPSQGQLCVLAQSGRLPGGGVQVGHTGIGRAPEHPPQLAVLPQQVL